MVIRRTAPCVAFFAAQISASQLVSPSASAGAVDGPLQGFAPAVPGSWTWNPIAGSQCMNGEETGAWIRYGPHGAAGPELGIYLHGGGEFAPSINMETASRSTSLT